MLGLPTHLASLCSIAPAWDNHPLPPVFPKAAHSSRMYSPQSLQAMVAIHLRRHCTEPPCCRLGSPSHERVLVLTRCLLKFFSLCVSCLLILWWVLKCRSCCMKERHEWAQWTHCALPAHLTQSPPTTPALGAESGSRSLTLLFARPGGTNLTSSCH